MKAPHSQSRDPKEVQHSLSTRDVLTIIFKRRIMISVVAATIVALVTTLNLLAPPIYEVTASVLVNKSRAEIPLAPNDSPRLTTDQVSQQDLNSEIEILKSRHVIEDALLTLGVDETWRSDGSLERATRAVARALGAPELSIFEEMTIRLEQKLDISNVRRSNVIKVSYRSKDRERATHLVNALVERYIARRADMYQSPQAVSFFEQQMADAEHVLRVKEKTLENFLDEARIMMIKESAGSDALEAQKALGLERLAHLQRQLAETQAEIEERLRKKSRLEASLADEPERLRTASRFHHDAAIEESEKALAALQLKRDALLQEFEPGNRYVRDIESQISLVEDRLARAQGAVTDIDRTEINPVHQELKAEWLRVGADLQGSRGRLATLRVQLAECRQELDQLNNEAFEMKSLLRDVEVAEEAFMLYRRKHEEARIAAAMDRQRLINVSISQPAQIPLKPVAPRRTLNLLIGLLLGGVGGLSLAFVTELYLDHTLVTSSGLRRRLGIPYVIAIPDESAKASQNLASPSLKHRSASFYFSTNKPVLPRFARIYGPLLLLALALVMALQFLPIGWKSGGLSATPMPPPANIEPTASGPLLVNQEERHSSDVRSDEVDTVTSAGEKE